jgi:A/G-specific adenine glycosylase
MSESNTIAALSAWFAGAARALPWRRRVGGGATGRDPYATWVAEIMLQQTRVEVVAGRYERFLRAFPDVGALAAAPVAEVLREWAGLGYYRRARMLHEAAREISGPRGGRLPRSAEEWRALPGVGEYTAAAVAAQAYGEPVAAVDGNVKRVAARVLALDLASDDGALHRAARAWAQTLMDAADAPGVIVEALMELGATVCVPREPRCDACPLASGCAARARGIAREVPRAPKAKEWIELRLRAFVARRGGGALLRERTAGWNPGLWEPPTVASADGASAAEQWERLDCGRAGTLRPLGELRHVITRHRIRVEAFAVEDWRDGPQPVTPAAVGLTGLARKLLRADRDAAISR